MPKKIHAAPIGGWLLLCREEKYDDDLNVSGHGDWYIAWHEMFGRKKDAIAFAKKNGWGKPYTAVRGSLGPI